MKRVCVIDLPGLSRKLLDAVPTSSRLGQWLANNRVVGLTPSWPAVTCSVQATITTGVSPAHHGIVANGIATYRSAEDQARVDASNFANYRRDVSFWEQSNQFVEALRFWQDSSGKSKFKTALLFFQHSMPGFVDPQKPAADIVLTPKPDHGPDGKIVSLCWSEPRELVPQLFGELGPFPLMNYWGPMAGIASSAWIAKAAARVWRAHRPDLQLVYVPHLDYDLQRFGPSSPQATKAVLDLAGALDPLFDAVESDGGSIVVLSEYALSDVKQCCGPNRMLAEAGLLTTRETPDGKQIDYANSQAWAMVDHQVAHVYTKDAKATAYVRELLASGRPLSLYGRDAFGDLGINHRRSGDLFLVANDDTWFDYRWWSDPKDSPSFARMVDIHRKPGYDPLELFWDRAANGTQQDAGLIRGSHGSPHHGEAILAADSSVLGEESIQATDVARVVLTLMK